MLLVRILPIVLSFFKDLVTKDLLPLFQIKISRSRKEPLWLEAFLFELPSYLFPQLLLFLPGELWAFEKHVDFYQIHSSPSQSPSSASHSVSSITTIPVSHQFLIVLLNVKSLVPLTLNRNTFPFLLPGRLV